MKWRRKPATKELPETFEAPRPKFEDPFPSVKLSEPSILRAVEVDDTVSGVVRVTALSIGNALRPGVARATIGNTIEEWFADKVSEDRGCLEAVPAFAASVVPDCLVDDGQMVIDGLAPKLAYLRELRRLNRGNDEETIKDGLCRLEALVTAAYAAASGPSQAAIVEQFQQWRSSFDTSH